jgi:hypothetical protein
MSPELSVAYVSGRSVWRLAVPLFGQLRLLILTTFKSCAYNGRISILRGAAPTCRRRLVAFHLDAARRSRDIEQCEG